MAVTPAQHVWVLERLRDVDETGETRNVTRLTIGSESTMLDYPSMVALREQLALAIKWQYPATATAYEEFKAKRNHELVRSVFKSK